MKTPRIIKDKIRGVESTLLENNFQYFNIKKISQSLYLATSCIHVISEQGRCTEQEVPSQHHWSECSGWHLPFTPAPH